MSSALMFCRFVTAYSTLDLVQTPPWVNQLFSLKRYEQKTMFFLYLTSQTSNISRYIYSMLPIVPE